ncbi:hypothetical protein DH2020_028646 [Rehmannia glutinosa]|uniref:Uncharacterized protein n=1 Tax=Rehmannia glutinosa TaxID=99300 RepID=A0ABR0VV00_REHGL
MAKNKILSEEMGNKETLMNELEQLRISIKEMELLVKQGDDERIELEKGIMLMKCDAEESQKELNKMRCILQEKELIVEKVQSELDSLRSHYTELKRTLSEDALEKDELRKQVVLLKGDLEKREDALNNMETTSKTSVPVPQGSEEVSNLTERIKLLEDQIKLKESALETSNNAFLEKEKELHDEIGELEERLEVLNQSSIHFCENEVEKVTTLAEDQDPNFRSIEETRKHDKDSTNPKPRAPSSLSSNDTNSPETPQRSADKTGNLDELTNEMTLLKERNELMEAELKEMQERYSEISVKFAEVEGERQQLVMRVRNLKNAKKRT